MRSLYFCLFGIGLSIMSQTTSASANSSIMLETSQGQIEIILLPEHAPKHVKRISQLVSEGFYDGIIFHRVIQVLWPKPVTRQVQVWVARAKN